MPLRAENAPSALPRTLRSLLVRAWERMLEPLLDAEETAFLERPWDELSEREKRSFVEASVVRERVLLRRDPDLQRAKKVSDPAWRSN